MLSIFMSHTAKTSVLDDFNFYEKREKALREKRNASQTNAFRKSDYEVSVMCFLRSYKMYLPF